MEKKAKIIVYLSVIVIIIFIIISIVSMFVLNDYIILGCSLIIIGLLNLTIIIIIEWQICIHGIRESNNDENSI